MVASCCGSEERRACELSVADDENLRKLATDSLWERDTGKGEMRRAFVFESVVSRGGKYKKK